MKRHIRIPSLAAMAALSVITLAAVGAAPAMAQGHDRYSQDWNRGNSCGQGNYSQQNGPACDQGQGQRGYFQGNRNDGRFEVRGEFRSHRGDWRRGGQVDQGYGRDYRGGNGYSYRDNGGQGRTRFNGTWEAWQRQQQNAKRGGNYQRDPRYRDPQGRQNDPRRQDDDNDSDD